MRSTLYQKTDFLARMKRKPAQDELYQKAVNQTLTAEDIEKSGQPLWFRTALYELIERDGKTHQQSIDEIVARTEQAQKEASQQTYPVYEWKNQSWEITPTRGFSLTVEPGEFVLVDRQRKQVKIEYSLLDVDSVIIDFIEQNAILLGNQTDPMFIEMVGKKRSLKHR